MARKRKFQVVKTVVFLTNLLDMVFGKILRLKYKILSVFLSCYLVLKKRDQVNKFRFLANRSKDTFKKLTEKDVSEFLHPRWEGFTNEVDSILSSPDGSFLRNETIRRTMFRTTGGKSLKEELKFLEQHVPKRKLREILEEDFVGSPYMMNFKFMTSHNCICHLYHLMYFQQNTNVNIESLDTVVEWGGGYGNLAKIFKRINPKATYIIIDIPFFSCLQWLYLASVFGEESVNLIHTQARKIEKGKINLLPVCFVKQHSLNADFFIATWSLSESSLYSMGYVESRDFFHSNHLLLAFHQNNSLFSQSEKIGEIAKVRGARIHPISFLPGNFYAIC